MKNKVGFGEIVNPLTIAAVKFCRKRLETNAQSLIPSKKKKTKPEIELVLGCAVMSLLCCGQGIFLHPKATTERLSFHRGSLRYSKFSGHKECYSRRSLEELPKFICSSYYAGNIISPYPRFCTHSMENFTTPQFDSKTRNHKNLPRYVVANSELTGTGNPSSAFPLSELNIGSKVRGICFYSVTSVVVIFLFVLMVLAHPFVVLFDRYRRKAHHLIAKYWASLSVRPFFKIEFEGLENLPPSDTPAVYVSNHQSFLDIFTLLTLGRPFKFISKTSIFLIPIIGWAMFFLGVIPLKRMDSKSQMECLRRCMDLLKKGASVFFFPEGTRSLDGKLGVFKKGAFSVAAKLKAPVVPITLIGTGNLMPSGKEGILNKGSVKVVIHKPIEGSDAQMLCDQSRKVIAEALNC